MTARITKSKSSKKIKQSTGKSKTVKTPKTPKTYQGRPIEATRLFVRKMPQFKNCKAEVYMAVNEKDKTVTFMNVYNGLLKASYQPAHYTYEFNPKVHNQKMEEMKELEVVDFPSFVVNAHARGQGQLS